MRDTRNKDFAFGFLNNAQEAHDINDYETPDAYGVDVDKQALGMLVPSSYLYPSFPSGKSQLTAVLNGVSFRLAPTLASANPAVGALQRYVGGAWKWVAHGADVNNDTPWKCTGVAVGSGSSMGSELQLNGIADFAHTENTDPSRVWPAGTANSITVYFKVLWFGGLENRWRYYIKVDNGDWVDQNAITFGNLYNYDVGGKTLFYYKFNSDTNLVDNQVSSVYAHAQVLDDGVYSYSFVNVKIENGQNVMGPASDPGQLRIQNYAADGTTISSKNPMLDFTYRASVAPVNTDEIWVFRKDPSASDFVKIGKWVVASPTHFYTVTGVTLTNAAYQFMDSVEIPAINNPVLLTTEASELFNALDIAVGNTSGTFDRLFVKDNRLWIQPTSRKDILLYSEAVDWWNWKRTNSFAVNAPDTGVNGEPWGIVDSIDVRDTSVVSGTQTLVLFTSNGVYQIGGNGTENNPYTLYLTIRDIVCEPNTATFMGDSIIFLSRSPLWRTGATGTHPEAYNYGPYGQKMWIYDMVRVHEISSRVRNSTMFHVKDAVTSANQVGGGKYVITRGSANGLVYLKDAKGWMQTDVSNETAASWRWTSKEYHPDVLERMQIFNARSIKLEYQGTIAFKVQYHGFGPEGAMQEYTITFQSAVRTIVAQRLPQIRAMGISFVMTGTKYGSTLPGVYELKFVQ